MTYARSKAKKQKRGVVDQTVKNLSLSFLPGYVNDKVIDGYVGLPSIPSVNNDHYNAFVNQRPKLSSASYPSGWPTGGGDTGELARANLHNPQKPWRKL
jgi:hypothetical protein